MKTSPARRHREAEAARLAAEQGQDLSQLDTYQRLYKRLQDDKAVLKAIHGVSDKIQAKAQMLPAYDDWIRGVMAGGAPQADDKITPTVLVWRIDCGLLDDTLPLAEFAMHHRMDSADEYQRTLPEIIVEQYAEQIGNGCDIAPENLHTLIDWATAKDGNGLHLHNLHDQIRAKLLKAAGERAETDNQPAAALQLYEHALAYNEKIGVKKRIDALQKQLNATTA